MSEVSIGVADTKAVTLPSEPIGLEKGREVTLKPVVNTLTVSPQVSPTLKTPSEITLSVSGGSLVTTGKAFVTPARNNLFKDFAHFDIGGVDPAMAIITARTSGPAFQSGAPSDFRRVSATVVVPEDYSVSDNYLWGRAAFIGVGLRVNSLGAGEAVMVDGAQVEWARNGATAPTQYTPARSIRCNVRPSRLNWVSNPSFEANVSGWTAQRGSLTRVVDSKAAAGGAVCRYTSTDATSSNYLGHYLSAPIRQGDFLRAGISVRPTAATAGSFRLRIQCYDGDNNLLTTLYGDSTVCGADKWTIVKANGKAPANVRTARMYLFANAPVAVGGYFDVDAAIFERNPNLALPDDYFDGDSGRDYLWKQLGTPKNCESFYYEDYLSRSYVLRQILAENCPLGTTPAVPEFALLPKD